MKRKVPDDFTKDYLYRAPVQKTELHIHLQKKWAVSDPVQKIFGLFIPMDL
jgi:hypothetical protein